MALIKCKDCGNEISDTAMVCPHCARPMSEKKKGMGCLSVVFVGILLVALIFVLLFTFSDKPNISKNLSPKPVNVVDLEVSVKELTATGFIRKLNPDLNEVFVSRTLWETTSLDQKKTVGYVLGHYCGYKKGTKINWVEIRDYKTGKRLAKWSEAWGMTIDD